MGFGWRAMGLLFLVTQSVGASPYFSFTTDYPSSYSIDGFQWLSRLEYFRVFDGDRKSHTVSENQKVFTLTWEASSPKVGIVGEGVSVQADLTALLARARAFRQAHAGQAIPQKLLTEDQAGTGGSLRVWVEDVSVEDPGARVLHFKAVVAFRPVRSSSQTENRGRVKAE